MFTGIIESLGKVHETRQEGPGKRMILDAGDLAKDARIGDSVAISGCCLTVVTIEGDFLGFDVGHETLSRTILGSFKPGDPVNLERSLQVGDRLGGHFVTGHVDDVGILDKRVDEEQWSTFWFKMPRRLAKQMAGKGSVAVDGVSLTLVDVEEDRFSIALIPHTLKITSLGRLVKGDRVNLETDLLAKYVEKQLSGEEKEE